MSNDLVNTGVEVRLPGVVKRHSAGTASREVLESVLLFLVASVDGEGAGVGRVVIVARRVELAWSVG